MAHIQVQDGQIQVLGVQTTLADDAVLIQTAIEPTLTLSVNPLTTLPDPLTPALARRIFGSLNETYNPLPLTESGLSTQDQTHLNAFVAETGIQNGVFNIVLSAQVLLEKLARFPRVLIADHAQATPAQTPDALVLNWAPHLRYPVFYPYLQWVARQSGFHAQAVTFASHPQGISLLGLDRTEDVLWTQAVFQSPISEDSTAHAEACQALLDLSGVSADKLEAAIEMHLATLPQEAHDDYLILLSAASLWFEVDEFKKALDWAVRLPKRYRDIAVPYYLLMGRCYQGLNDPLRAELFLKQAGQIAPAYAAGHAQLGLMYVSQNRYEEALITLETFLACTTEIPWNLMITLALVALHQRRVEKSRALLTFVKDAAARFPSLIKEHILSQANLIYTQYFTSA